MRSNAESIRRLCFVGACAPVWDCNCDRGSDCIETRPGKGKLLVLDFWDWDCGCDGACGATAPRTAVFGGVAVVPRNSEGDVEGSS